MNIIKIIEFIRNHKLTKNQFCQMCKITPSILDGIIYYGKGIDYAVAEKISDAMGIGVYELYTCDY